VSLLFAPRKLGLSGGAPIDYRCGYDNADSVKLGSVLSMEPREWISLPVAVLRLTIVAAPALFRGPPVGLKFLSVAGPKTLIMGRSIEN